MGEHLQLVHSFLCYHMKMRGGKLKRNAFDLFASSRYGIPHLPPSNRLLTIEEEVELESCPRNLSHEQLA